MRNSPYSVQLLPCCNLLHIRTYVLEHNANVTTLPATPVQSFLILYTYSKTSSSYRFSISYILTVTNRYRLYCTYIYPEGEGGLSHTNASANAISLK